MRAARGELQALLRGPVHVMLEAWIAELMRECIGSRRKEVIDKNVRFACDLHAYNLLLFRTVDAASLTEDTAKTLACGPRLPSRPYDSYFWW